MNCLKSSSSLSYCGLRITDCGLTQRRESAQKTPHSTLAAVQTARVRNWLAFFLFPFCLFLLTASAQSTNDSSSNDSQSTDYSSFQVISERNIFNPNRYGSTYHPHYESHEVPTFSLAGTMSYRKGMFAFFSGTSESYRKALEKGGTIAGYTVAKIDFDGVQLQSSSKTIDMKVGAAMQREGDAWELTAPGAWGETVAADSASGDQSTDQTSTNLPSSGGGEGNDVLKRLMEKREQELK
jgi:hypothetical protein